MTVMVPIMIKLDDAILPLASINIRIMNDTELGISSSDYTGKITTASSKDALDAVYQIIETGVARCDTSINLTSEYVRSQLKLGQALGI